MITGYCRYVKSVSAQAATLAPTPSSTLPRKNKLKKATQEKRQVSCDWWILRILTSDWSGAQGGQNSIRHPAGVHPHLDPLQRAGCDEGNSYFCNTISWTHAHIMPINRGVSALLFYFWIDLIFSLKICHVFVYCFPFLI